MNKSQEFLARARERNELLKSENLVDKIDRELKENRQSWRRYKSYLNQKTFTKAQKNLGKNKKEAEVFQQVKLKDCVDLKTVPKKYDYPQGY